MQVALGKAGPAVAVEFARLLKIVPEQVQDHDLAAGPEDFVGAADGRRRIFRMVQRLAEDDQIHTVRLHGRVLEVALAEFEVFQPVLAGLGRAEATIFSELSTAMTFLQRRASSSLSKPSPAPRSATTMGGKMRRSKWPKACQDRPGPYTRSKRPATWLKNTCACSRRVEHTFEVDLVAGVFGQFLGPADGQLDELAGHGVGNGVELVKRPFAGAPRAEQARSPSAGPGGWKCATGPGA